MSFIETFELQISLLAKTFLVVLVKVFIYNLYYISYITINPQAPVAQKIVDELIFRRSQGEEVEFF